jgi:methionyl-tRNA formyltransferase
MTLRLAFMGTPDFAVPILEALIAARHEMPAVYTQPPRPAGRGHRPQPSPVERAAAARGIEVRSPTRLDAAEVERWRALGLDAAVVAAYGLILPPGILTAPRFGCLNVHASLLPRWRGAAPTQRAILAGDTVTGITIMQMEEGLDTGPILLQEAVPIEPDTGAEQLHDRLALVGARLIVAVLDQVSAGTLVPRAQPSEGVTYAKKLRRDEGRLDWREDAAVLERAVRALNPAPGVWFEHAGERIKVLRAQVAARERDATPGTVLDDRLTVACGVGALRLETLQRAGRAPLAAGEFLRGYPIPRDLRL